MIPYHKWLHDFNFDFQPKIKKSEIQDLVTLRFWDTYDNILFIGNSDVGKKHLAVSIGLDGIDRGQSCLFITSTEIVNRLIRAHKRGTSDTMLKKYLFYFFIKIKNCIKFFFVKFYYFYIGKAGKLECFPSFFLN